MKDVILVFGGDKASKLIAKHVTLDVEISHHLWQLEFLEVVPSECHFIFLVSELLRLIELVFDPVVFINGMDAQCFFEPLLVILDLLGNRMMSMEQRILALLQIQISCRQIGILPCEVD